MSLSYTRRLNVLPPPTELFSRASALAIIELAINERTRLRWHSFDPLDRRVVAIDSGSGDEANIWLTDAGCVIRGFDHESDLSPWAFEPRQTWSGLFDGFPAALSHGPTLSVSDGVENVTFVLWWLGEGPWRTGTLAPDDPTHDDMDGSHFLLDAIVTDAAARSFLTDYYELRFPADIFDRPLWPFVDLATIADLPNLRSTGDIVTELASLGITPA